MLGFFSIPKILFTILVAIAIWYAFKWWGRRTRIPFEESAKVRRGKSQVGADFEFDDMIKCRECGAYVPAGSNHQCV